MPYDNFNPLLFPYQILLYDTSLQAPVYSFNSIREALQVSIDGHGHCTTRANSMRDVKGELAQIDILSMLVYGSTSPFIHYNISPDPVMWFIKHKASDMEMMWGQYLAVLTKEQNWNATLTINETLIGNGVTDGEIRKHQHYCHEVFTNLDAFNFQLKNPARFEKASQPIQFSLN